MDKTSLISYENSHQRTKTKSEVDNYTITDSGDRLVNSWGVFTIVWVSEYDGDWLSWKWGMSLQTTYPRYEQAAWTVVYLNSIRSNKFTKQYTLEVFSISSDSSRHQRIDRFRHRSVWTHRGTSRKQIPCLSVCCIDIDTERLLDHYKYWNLWSLPSFKISDLRHSLWSNPWRISSFWQTSPLCEVPLKFW